MSATRLSLLGAFAGGCLSAGVLFGLWRAETGAGAATQKPVARNSALVAASIIDPGTALGAGQQRDATADAARTPIAAAQTEPAPAEAAADAVASAPPAPKDAQDATPGGSAVSDVLTDLEAAYRQRLIAAARAEAEAERAPTPAPVAANPAPAPVEARPEVAPPRAAAPVVPVMAAVAPEPAAPVPSEPPAPPPAPVAQNDVRPPDIHIGDVNQNTYITNVRQGDVYVTQQLAMLQYMQFLGAASAAGPTQPAHVTRGAAQRSPQFRQFPSTLTNLDNPWGFNFAPPNLVH